MLVENPDNEKDTLRAQRSGLSWKKTTSSPHTQCSSSKVNKPRAPTLNTTKNQPNPENGWGEETKRWSRCDLLKHDDS